MANSAALKKFIECTSVSISYDIMGIATISYSVVSNTPGLNVDVDGNNDPTNIVYKIADQTYYGYVTSASLNRIPNTSWYETHVSIVATTDRP